MGDQASVSEILESTAAEVEKSEVLKDCLKDDSAHECEVPEGQQPSQALVVVAGVSVCVDPADSGVAAGGVLEARPLGQRSPSPGRSPSPEYSATSPPSVRIRIEKLVTNIIVASVIKPSQFQVAFRGILHTSVPSRPYLRVPSRPRKRRKSSQTWRGEHALQSARRFGIKLEIYRIRSGTIKTAARSAVRPHTGGISVRCKFVCIVIRRSTAR